MSRCSRLSRTLLVGVVFTPALGLGAAPAAARQADWPGWRGPHRDGKSADTGLLKEWPEGGPRLLWKAGGLGRGYSSPAVKDDTIYITGDLAEKLVLFALDLDGSRRWQQEIDAAWSDDPPGARSTPTVDGGRVYLLSGNGLIACLDARSGKRRWSRSTREFGGRPGGWGYSESVLVTNDLAIVKPGGQKCIAALDKRTGDTVWTSSGFEAGPEYSSAIAVEFEGTPLVITGTRAGIVAVDARSGKLLWQNDWSADNTANCPTPVYSGGYVFWANGYGRGGICLELRRDGAGVAADVAWTTKDMVCHHGGYIVDGGHIYGNHSNGWSCLELTTGRKRWSERGVGKGSLCWADGMLVLFSEDGGRAALATCSPAGLELRGEVQVEGRGPSWAHPVVAGERLYLRYDTTLYAFAVASRGAEASGSASGGQ